MGDDFKVRFLHDLWCGDMALKNAFPILFDIVQRMLMLRLMWNFLNVPFSGT